MQIHLLRKNQTAAIHYSFALAKIPFLQFYSFSIISIINIIVIFSGKKDDLCMSI